MRGERLGPQHLDALAPMLAEPRVAATMGGALDREQVAQQLADFDAKWERDGLGYYMWFDVGTGEAVARGGLSRTEFDGRPELEAGGLVTPERWGGGLATELGAAAGGGALRPGGARGPPALPLSGNTGAGGGVG